MIKQIKSETIPLTHAVASDFAAMKPCVCERELTKPRCDFIRSKIRDGLFYSPSWAVAWLRGEKLRVNGQHTSHVIAEMNGEFPKGMDVFVQEFSCDDDNDVAELFSQFDSVTSARSPRDVAGAHGKIHAELREIAPTIISRAISGVAYALANDRENPVGIKGTESKARLVHENVDFVKWTNDYIGDRFMSRRSVVAAMYMTYRKNRSDASKFWDLVKNESHPDNTNPSRILGKYLRTEQERVIKGKGAKFVSAAFLVKSIHAWNAWRGGNRTDLKCYDTAKIPKLI